MADFLTKAQRSTRMAAIRSRGNKETELVLIDIFRENKITGWRRHQRMEGNPDFTFKSERVVIFVDGCFWHACPKHSLHVLKSRPYWQRKLVTNMTRDRAVTRSLRRKGWRVIRIWEHELRRSNRPKLVRRIESALQEI